MLRKAFDVSTDVIMLDLEDSVPAAEKTKARAEVVRILREGPWRKQVRAYRINAMDTSFAYRDVIDVIEAAGQWVDIVVVPKINDPAEIKALDYLLSQIELHLGLSRRIGLEASIETAEGMLRVGEIAFSSTRLEALVFGVADYSASLSVKSKGVSGHGEADDFYPGHRWHYPLSRLAMAAKAAGLAAIDAPYGNYKDPDGLRESCMLSAGLGYDGKWAIHPDQLELINQAYSPAMEDVERSRRILTAYAEAQAKGQGSLTLDGKMVDAASVRIAEVIAAQWDAICQKST